MAGMEIKDSGSLGRDDSVHNSIMVCVMTQEQQANKSAEKQLRAELRKLFGAYYRAEGAMIKKRDELYPKGTMVKLNCGNTATVVEGSLYPHQVLTNMWGHCSWWNLEKL